jgi:hypothetical protein
MRFKLRIRKEKLYALKKIIKPTNMKQLIQNIKDVLITEDSHTMTYISVAVQKKYRTEIVIFIIKALLLSVLIL